MFWIWVVATLIWWGFAFAPTDQTSPEWFEAARNACFGTLANGLPDTSGWLILILGPASFLIALLVAWHEELISGLRDFVKNPAGAVVIFASLGMTGLEASWVYTKIDQGRKMALIDFNSNYSGDLPDDYPRGTLKISNFELINQAGEKIQLNERLQRGKPLIISFAFAYCTAICPALIQQLKEAYSEMGPEKAELLLITLDPYRDTPSLLPGIAERWKFREGMHLLSGPIKNVEKALKDLNVPYQRNQKTGNVDHPALTYVISPQGELVYTLNNVPPRWIAQAVDRINRP